MTGSRKTWPLNSSEIAGAPVLEHAQQAGSIAARGQRLAEAAERVEELAPVFVDQGDEEQAALILDPQIPDYVVRFRVKPGEIGIRETRRVRTLANSVSTAAASARVVESESRISRVRSRS